MYRRTMSTAVTLLLTVVIGCPASAQQYARIVSYHDLDLSAPIGVRTFRRRLSRAVDYVCRLASPGDDMLKAANRQCREDAARAVRPQMKQAIALARMRAGTQFATR